MATSPFTSREAYWLREVLPLEVIRCINEADMFVAFLWNNRDHEVGLTLDNTIYETGFTSLGNWRPYGNYVVAGDEGTPRLMTQDWVTLSMTMPWSRFYDDVAKAAGNARLKYREIDEKTNALFNDWADYFALQIYGSGGTMTVGTGPSAHAVEMLDGIDLAVGQGAYAGLTPGTNIGAACWQSYQRALTGSTWATLTTAGTNHYLPRVVDIALAQIKRGSIGPNIIVCDSIVEDAWRAIAEANMMHFREERITIRSNVLGELGYEVLSYRGIPIWPSPTLNTMRDDNQTNQMYILNTDYFTLYTFPGYEFTLRGPTELEALGDTIAYAWVFVGQLQCTGRRWQGKITSLPITGPPAP